MAPTPTDVRKLRQQAGMTQTELARRADCSVTYVQMVEQGSPSRKGEIRERILTVLNDAKGERADAYHTCPRCNGSGKVPR